MSNAQPEKTPATVAMDVSPPSLIGNISNVVNSVIGSGIVAMPFTFAKVGWGLALGVMVAVGWITYVTFNYYVVAADHVHRYTTRDICSALWTRKIGLLADLFIILLVIAYPISYLIICSDFVISIVNGIMDAPPDWLIDHRVLKTGFAVLLCFPICCLPDVRFLQPTSIVAVFSIVFLVATVVSKLFSSGLASNLVFASFSMESLSALPILTSALGAQFNMPIILRSVGGDANFQKKTNFYAIIVASMILFIAGGAGYAQFGPDVKDNILAGYRDDSMLIATVRGLMIFVVVTTFPLVVWPVRQSCIHLWEALREEDKDLDVVNDPYESIVFGGGCFYDLDALFKRVGGVVSVTCGYVGEGKTTYEEVCNGSGHSEAVLLKYDPSLVTLESLLDIFFEMHDFSVVEGQYKSYIGCSGVQEAQIIEHLSRMEDDVGTMIALSSTFYEAENEHQNFYDRNRTAPQSTEITEKLARYSDLFEKSSEEENLSEEEIDAETVDVEAIEVVAPKKEEFVEEVRDKKWWTRHISFAAILTAIAVVCSIAVPSVSDVFGFFGSVFGSIVCYILPGLMMLRVERERAASEKRGPKKGTVAFCYFCVVGGAILFGALPFGLAVREKL